ncbi:LOW QUALITY PROTEIN: putative transmembrane efflux protein [Geomicrobium sp. JCM 19037]|nr:LOW QUALITY PROTEIN: putative transmembrane efflux protein [Geomicrobium sp. JCM 19037]
MNFSRKMILAVFMLGTFAVGMTEYVVTGLLTQFAEDLNVEVSTTGLLLTVYAISVAIFGPILRIVTLKFSPKPLLLALMILFILSNILAATAPNFDVLLLSRLFSAAMHAPFFGICMYIAISISDPTKRTGQLPLCKEARSIMIGVPFGSFLGGMFDWRLVFWFMAALGLLTLIGLWTTPNIRPSEVPKVKDELQMLKNKNVLMTIAIIVLGFSGVFTAYTFKEPMYREFAGFDVTGITLGLFFFGLGAVIGNFVSGSVRPSRLTSRLLLALAALAVVLVSFTHLLAFAPMAIVMSFLFGAGTFGTTPLLNAKIILAAKEAPSLSGTIAASVFNLANAIGAALGSFLLGAGFSYTTITYVAGAMITFGLILTFINVKTEDRSVYEA